MAAARNLFIDCAGLTSGDGVFIVTEPAQQGYYDPVLAAQLERCATALGLRAQVAQYPFPLSGKDDSADKLAHHMATHDCTVFLSRLGDQRRFDEAMTSSHVIVCYALTLDMLASAFGRTSHKSMLALRDFINQAMGQTDDIRISCPLGTQLTASAPQLTATGDTTIVRFPLSVYTPVPAQTLTGQIAQAGFLVGTGSNYYDPFGAALDDILTIHVENGRILGFDGLEQDVAAARAHYLHVADMFGIDPWVIHSWHGGIHPGCRFAEPAGLCLERWSGGAFGNPRLLHFHSCGDFPPGEICLNIVDPTVSVAGLKLWENGRLNLERVTGGGAFLETHPDITDLCASPETDIGLGPNGRLSFSADVV